MRRGVFIGLTVGGLGLTIVAFALLARFVLHGSVTAHSLHVSVERAAGSAGPLLSDPGGCRRARNRGVWLCAVTDHSGSGGAEYRVRVRDGTSCWRARRVGRRGYDGEMPRDITGCVRLWQWSLLSD